MKKPFDIDTVMVEVEEMVAPLPKAVLFDLAAIGYKTAFQQAVACIVSARTQEQITAVVVRRLFELAADPAGILELSVAEIDALIEPCSFHQPKAKNIHDLARIAIDYGGDLPNDKEKLLALPGIGSKCATLVRAIAFGESEIGVDSHVHRVTNRWGYVSANAPEKSEVELSKILPVKYWVATNRLLVPFGKYICTSTLPKCSRCQVEPWCQQVGVDAHR